MKTLHRRKQKRDILLRQVGIFFTQGLTRIKCQGFAAPPLPGLEKWRCYLAGSFENHAQMRIDALVSVTRIVLPTWRAE